MYPSESSKLQNRESEGSRSSKENYFTTFGEANVNFRILARLANIEVAETAIKAKLIHFRIRGTTGRPNEWLENIQAEEVIGVVLQTLKDLERMGRITIQSWGINTTNF